MNNIKRLFLLYKLKVDSFIKSDTYFINVDFLDGNKFDARHKIGYQLSTTAKLNGMGVKDYLDQMYLFEAYRCAKKAEAKQYLKTLNRYNSNLLSKYLNR